MIDENKNSRKIEDYLLNKSSEDVCREIERKLLTDDEFYDFFLTVECDLYEKYLEGEYSPDEKSAFEEYFLAHPQRQEDLWLTRALKEKAKNNKPLKEIEISKKPSFRNFNFRKILPVWATVLVILVLTVGGFLWWNNSQNSELNNVLAALRKAFSKERPLESRIADLDYAPFSPTRGKNEPANSTELALAEKYLFEAVNNKPSADIFYAYGKYYLAKNDFDGAIDNFREAVKLKPDDSKLNNDFGVAYLEKGKQNRLIGENGKAAVDFAQSLELFNKSLTGREILPEALFNRSLLYQNLLLPEKSREDWQKYLAKDSTSKWADDARRQLKLLDETNSNSNLSNEKIFEDFQTAYRNHDVRAAWETIKLSRSRMGIFIADKLIDEFLEEPSKTDENLKMLNFAGSAARQMVGDAFLSDLAGFYAQLKPSQFPIVAKARSAVNDGRKYYGGSEMENAIEKFTEAENLFKSVQNSPEELFADICISFCKLRIPKNQIHNEIASFTELAQTFDKKHYYSLQAQSLQGLADAQSGVFEFSKSLESITKSLYIAETNQDIETRTRCYQTRALLYNMLGKYKDSLVESFAAFDFAKTAPTKPAVLWTFYFIAAKDFFQLGFQDTADAYQEKYIQLAEQAKTPLLKSRSFEQAATFYLLNDNFEKAVEAGEKAIDFGEKVDSKQTRLNIISRLSLLLGDIYRKSGDQPKALDYYQKSQEIYEQIDYKAKLYQIFRGRALTYMALQNNDLAKAQLDEAITQSDLFRQKIYEESYRNSFFDTEQGTYDVAVDFAYSQLNDDVQALNYSEINRARSLFDLLQTDKYFVQQKSAPEIFLKSVISPLDVSKLQSRIPDNAQILEFAVLENKIISWVVTKEGIKSAATPISSDNLRQKIRNYLEAINSNTEAEQLAKELYQILLTPNEAFLDARKNLFIVPDKDLHFLPFSALIKPETNQYLIEKFTLGISPSLNVFVLNSAKAEEKISGTIEEKLLAVGNPIFNQEKHKGLEYLPSAVRETDRISQFYAPQNRVLLLNKEATKLKVLEMMKNFEVIHFASHALTDENTPMLSGLVLADSGDGEDGMLKAFEIYQQKLPKTKLVVLSACQTGIEQAFRGEGAISLARPFIALGVPVVVASLWKVESEPTNELMINFYHQRKEKKLNSLEALRQAQIEMINSENPLFKKPKSWASFTAISGESGF